MITKISGVLNRVLDEEVRLQVGPLEYQVLIPEFVRRQVQTRVGQEVTLHTSQEVDGNVLEDAYQALMSVGHSPAEARDRLDKILSGGRSYKSVEEILLEIYKTGK